MSNLVGDVKGDINSDTESENFLSELEALMERYRIDRVDVSWKRPASCERCGHDSVTGEQTDESLSDANATVMGTADGPVDQMVDERADLGGIRNILTTKVSIPELAEDVEMDEALNILEGVTNKMDARDAETPQVIPDIPNTDIIKSDD